MCLCVNLLGHCLCVCTSCACTCVWGVYLDTDCTCICSPLWLHTCTYMCTDVKCNDMAVIALGVTFVGALDSESTSMGKGQATPWVHFSKLSTPSSDLERSLTHNGRQLQVTHSRLWGFLGRMHIYRIPENPVRELQKTILPSLNQMYCFWLWYRNAKWYVFAVLTLWVWKR